MNQLESAIKNALDAAGNDKEANKAYLEFIKANFIIPIDKNSQENAPEVLFLREQEYCFLPAFTQIDYFSAWAEKIADTVAVLNLSGVDLLKGIGENVTICLNIGSDLYKEFNPAEKRECVVWF